MLKNKAFTLAEILISLTIIGIIAALTLPALMANLNEKVWNTKRKALHSRMAQALAAMPNLDKYLENEDNSAAFNFINDGLATTLNITKVCDEDNMSKCDFNWPERAFNDEALDHSPWGDPVSFNTINGESIGIMYNSACNGETSADFLSTTNNMGNGMMCASFIYDLNGASKGPNRIGKDMGLIAAYFPEYPLVVAPMPSAMTENEVGAGEVEDFLSANSEYRLPSPAEVAVLSFYAYFLRGNESDREFSFWSDNNIICKSTGACAKATDNSKAETSAYLLLVSKNGDAPKTFKTLEDVKACDKEDKPDCKTGDKAVCDNSTGKWNCVHQ